MQTKKLFVILISVLFFFSVLFCCIILFSVKDVAVDYTVYEKGVEGIDEKFQKFQGKNLLFIKEAEVYETLNDNPYYEITEVVKDYPNVLNVKVVERKATYYMTAGETVYKTTAEGIVLETQALADFSDTNRRDMIYATFNGVTVQSSNFGQVIKTDADALINSVFEMTKAVDNADCIESIEIINLTEKKDAVFFTYTGTIIEVVNADDSGIEKITKAFEAYHGVANDFDKSHGRITTDKDENGNIFVHRTEDNK